MSSDTERPRQRTVAELLAEHGGAASSSRRRRRRSSDDEPAESVATVGVAATVGGPAGTQRPTPGYGPAPDAPEVPRQAPYGRADQDERLEAYRAVSRPVPPEMPTDTMPRVRAAQPAAQPAAPEPAYADWARANAANADTEAATGPIARVSEIGATTATTAAAANAATATTATPATPPPGIAEATTAVPARPADGGPATEFSRPALDDEDDAHEWDDDWSDDQWDDEHAGEPRPDREPGAVDRADTVGTGDGPSTGYYDVEAEEYGRLRTDEDGPAEDVDAEQDLHGEHSDDDHGDHADEERPARSGPSWPAVIAQWIAGAIGGAALWVAFRYLWKGFPIVAIAAALVVTAGLVIIVRALLHNRDMRTTIFAVLVGLLLTASPAVLVLIGR